MKLHHLACLVIAACVLSAAVTAPAHDGEHPDRPNPSPNASITQEVGHGKITVDHGSPGVKGREGKIWGELVPYNEGKLRPWSAGANGNAVITFSEDVTVNGHKVPAGSYGLMMIPAKGDWTIVLSNNNKRLGIIRYTPDEDYLRFTATPKEAPYREWLAYEFHKTGDFEATLNMHWENLRVGFDIVAPDHKE